MANTKTPKSTNTVNAESVKKWLAKNPTFFLENNDALLKKMYVPHVGVPQGWSLLEYQNTLLRVELEKVKYQLNSVLKIYRSNFDVLLQTKDIVSVLLSTQSAQELVKALHDHWFDNLELSAIRYFLFDNFVHRFPDYSLLQNKFPNTFFQGDANVLTSQLKNTLHKNEINCGAVSPRLAGLIDLDITTKNAITCPLVHHKQLGFLVAAANNSKQINKKMDTTMVSIVMTCFTTKLSSFALSEKNDTDQNTKSSNT